MVQQAQLVHTRQYRVNAMNIHSTDLTSYFLLFVSKHHESNVQIITVTLSRYAVFARTSYALLN